MRTGIIKQRLIQSQRPGQHPVKSAGAVVRLPCVAPDEEFWRPKGLIYACLPLSKLDIIFQPSCALLLQTSIQAATRLTSVIRI